MLNSCSSPHKPRQLIVLCYIPALVPHLKLYLSRDIRGGWQFRLAPNYHKLFHIPSWIPGRKMENAMYPDDKEMYRQVT